MHPRQPLLTYADYLLEAQPDATVAAGVAELDARGRDLAYLYDHVLAPAARRVGDMWHTGRITVADEHAATATLQRTMAAARATVEREKSRDELIVLACPEAEAHAVGLQMLADVLEVDGFDVRVLGADTPAHDTARFAIDRGAAAVALSCATPIGLVGLTNTISAIRGAAPELPIVVGGRCLETYPKVLAADATTAVELTTRDGRDAFRKLFS
jgi:MerR family transcriptional regulator, light-induced transcriptional regulator